MAKNSIRDFDSTAANNTDIQSTDISEGCAASGINNAIRELMADIKDVSTGAVNLETPVADGLTIGTSNLDMNGNELILDADADTSITADTDDQIDFKTGGSDRMVITSNGSVGIGASTVDRQLHIEGNRTNSYSSTDFDNTYNLMKIENPNTSTNAATGMQFLVGSNGSASISVTRVGDGQADMCFGTRGGGTRKERMRLTNTGDLLIGSTSNVGIGKVSIDFSRVTNAGIELETDGTAATRMLRFKNPNGTVGEIVSSGSSTTYYTSSDHRLKENVVDMTGAIARVKQLAPKRFNFIADDTVTVDGFIAHEAQTVVPEAVGGEHNEVDDDGNAVMQGIDQSKLVPLLVGALKESITKIETLETEMTALKARVTALEDA